MERANNSIVYPSLSICRMPMLFLLVVYSIFHFLVRFFFYFFLRSSWLIHYVDSNFFSIIFVVNMFAFLSATIKSIAVHIISSILKIRWTFLSKSYIFKKKKKIQNGMRKPIRVAKQTQFFSVVFARAFDILP